MHEHPKKIAKDEADKTSMADEVEMQADSGASEQPSTVAPQEQLTLSYGQIGALLMRRWSIPEATVLLMMAFLFSASLGVIRQMFFNAQFGAGSSANAYYAAFRLPDTIFSLIAGGALSSAMIPVLIGAARSGGSAVEQRLTDYILTGLFAVFAIVVFLGELLTPWFVRNMLAPGFDASTTRLTIILTRIMLLQPLILATSSVASAVLNSRNQFLLPAISVASHNLALLAGLFLSYIDPRIGIYGPTIGILLGAVLQVLILYPALRLGHFRYRPRFNLRDPHLREVIRLLIPNGLSVGVNYAGFIVDTAFASKSPEQAGLAAIHNAWMLTSLPISLLGQAVAQSAFPRLAAYADARSWHAMRRTLLRSLGMALLFTIPTVLALIVLGREAIRLLFEHGKFDASAGTLTYAVLTLYAIGLPAYVATEVITRGLIALHDTRTPLLTNSMQLAGRAGLIMMLLPRMGVTAIPLAFLCTASIETVALGLILWFKIRRRMRAT